MLLQGMIMPWSPYTIPCSVIFRKVNKKTDSVVFLGKKLYWLTDTFSRHEIMEGMEGCPARKSVDKNNPSGEYTR